ncbi:hypothetical protein RRF57_010789 [Xylaria bambusicola]|uniref:Uncharacterized protein n=1 Tax=Xylaria bambusicola TaxID=326684 RepID=A0AAN7Z9Q4_9PEZI
MPIRSAIAATRNPPVSSMTSQRPGTDVSTVSAASSPISIASASSGFILTAGCAASHGSSPPKCTFAQHPTSATISSLISRILEGSLSSSVQWFSSGMSSGSIENRLIYFRVFSSLYLAREYSVFWSMAVCDSMSFAINSLPASMPSFFRASISFNVSVWRAEAAISARSVMATTAPESESTSEYSMSVGRALSAPSASGAGVASSGVGVVVVSEENISA